MTVDQILTAVMNLYNALGLSGAVQAMIVISLGAMLLARLLNRGD